jgi:glycyl-tRNA synthetase beta chain
MVFEFPELQGIMGRAYAQVVDGEPDAIALAIEEMYQPRGADDALPASPAGAALSVADKLDSIVGCCAVGLGPTGSADPYALRRQALGVLRIVVAHDMRVSLQALVDRALAQYPQADAPAVRAQVLQLLRGRFETILRDAGVRYDIVDAVLASPGWEHVARSHHTAQQLMQCLPHDAFRRACTVVERCHNITRDAAFEVSAVDATRFVDAREETVWSAWQRARTALQQAISGNDVHGAVTVLAGELHTALHCFFDDVRVNVDDAGLRTNRLRLLRTIRDVIVAEFADLSKIVFEHTP